MEVVEDQMIKQLKKRMKSFLTTGNYVRESDDTDKRIDEQDQWFRWNCKILNFT